MKKISSLTLIALCATILTLWAGVARGQVVPTPFYSVTGTNGTGGGTGAISVTPVNAPSGSTALVDLRGTTNFNFGTGHSGLAGWSITNTWTSQSDLQVLAGTLGAGGVLSNFTLTVWFRQPPATINNYRLGLISAGSLPTTGSADGGATGNKLYFGENSGGGFQFYVNNQNGNSVGTSIAGPNTWNNNGMLGALQPDTWYFVAITYHIDANSLSNRCILYSGNQFNTAIQAATFTGLGGNLGGPLDLSAATSICLMNRFSGTRAFPGELDCFNIFTNALSYNEVIAVQGWPPYPPPPCTFPMPRLPSVAPTNTFYALSSSGVILTESVGCSALPLYYQWLTDGGGGGALTNIPGSNSTTLYFFTTNVGTYKFACLVTNSYGPATSPTAQVYVLPPSVPILTSDMNSLGAAGGNMLITNVYSFIGGNAGFAAQFALGTQPITNQWIADTGSGYVSIAGATGDTLNLTNIQTAAAGHYQLTATNLIGGSNSSPGTLTVLADPGAPTAVNTYAYAVYTNNPWAYWRFEETNDTFFSSMQAYDYSGHQFHATYGHSSDGTTATGCRDGGENILNGQYGPGQTGDHYAGFETANGCAGMQFGAANGYLTVPPLNLNTNTVTFTMWIYPYSAAISVYTGLLFNRNGTDAAGVGFGSTFKNGTPCLGYTWNNNTWTHSWNSGLFTVANVWSFVAYVMTPTNTTIYLYYVNNGQTNLLKAVNNVANAPESFSGGITRLGGDYYTDDTFNGSIDEVAVFKDSLGEDRIRDLFMKAIKGFIPPLPPAINFADGMCVLTWTGGSGLLEATNVSGPWTTNTHTSPFTFSPTGAAKFYRTYYP